MIVDIGKHYVDRSGNVWIEGGKDFVTGAHWFTRYSDNARCAFDTLGQFYPMSRQRCQADAAFDFVSEVQAPGLAKDPPDPVSHPAHYAGHPSGVECITVTEHMNFCRGNAMKYIWRAGDKGDEIQDLEKAVWYLNREIARLKKQA